MKLTLKALLVALLCVGFAQVIRPETVRVKLLKTDPTTWNKPFYYNVNSLVENKIIETPVIPKATALNKRTRAAAAARTPKITTNRDSIMRPPRPIKKDVTISFDNIDKNILFVCSKSGAEANPECGKLILSTGDPQIEPDYKTDHVIAIGKDYQPVSRPKSVVNALIKKRQAKFFKIPVYKEDPETWGQKWTITLVDEKGEPYPEAQVDIYRDSKIKKLLIRKQIKPGKTFVHVRKPNGLYIVETLLEQSPVAEPANQLLVINGQGNARIVDKSLYKPAPKAPRRSPRERLSEQGIPLSDLPAV